VQLATQTPRRGVATYTLAVKENACDLVARFDGGRRSCRAPGAGQGSSENRVGSRWTPHWLAARRATGSLVDLDAAFGRGSNPNSWRGRRQARLQGRDVRRHPRRRFPYRALPPAAPSQLGSRAGEPAVVCGHAETVTKSRSGSMSRSTRKSSRRAPVRGRGWETDGGDCGRAERLDSEGCSRFVVTDVTKEGHLAVRISNCWPVSRSHSSAGQSRPVGCPAWTTARYRHPHGRGVEGASWQKPLRRTVHPAAGAGRGGGSRTRNGSGRARWRASAILDAAAGRSWWAPRRFGRP